MRVTRGAASAPEGFTLVEVVVVLLLLGLTVALVAPTIFSGPSDATELVELTRRSRDAAVRRAQVLRLRMDAEGRWRLETAAGRNEGTLLASGRISTTGSPTTLLLSPFGSCTEPIGPETAGAPSAGPGAVPATGELLVREPLSCVVASR